MIPPPPISTPPAPLCPSTPLFRSALPNDERTFTVTLFMALHAEPGNDDPHFDSVATAADARALCERDFPDTLPLIPELADDFEANPIGSLATLRLERW